jgi:hypothetical protein
MVTKKVLLGTTYNKTKQYGCDVAMKKNKTERAKTEVLVAVYSGKNVSGLSARNRKKRINKMLEYNKSISQAITNVVKSRGRAAVSLRLIRKKQSEINVARKKLCRPALIVKKRRR